MNRPARELFATLVVIPVLVAVAATAWTAAVEPTLLLLDRQAQVAAERALALGLVVQIAFVAVGCWRECLRSAALLEQLAEEQPCEATAVHRFSLIPVRVLAYQAAGIASATLLMWALATTVEPMPASVRGMVALLYFANASGFHVVTYVLQRRLISSRLLRVDPLVSARACRSYEMPVPQVGTLSLRVAFGVSLSVFWVAEAALLHAGAQVRHAFELELAEIGHDVGVVLSDAPSSVADRVAGAAWRADVPVPPGPWSVGPVPETGDAAPPALRPTVSLAVLGSVLLLGVCALTVYASARLARSFARAVKEAAAGFRTMGGDAPALRAELVEAARYRDITDLLLVTNQLDAVFQRFAAAQRAAAQSNLRTERMRAQFLAAMSHDLKSPLNAVLGFSELLLQRPLGRGQRENATIVKHRGEELLLLIQTVLDSARMEVEHLHVGTAMVLLEHLAAEAVEKALELSSDGEVPIAVELDGDHHVLADAERLRFAILLLLRTAMRLTAKGREVIVRRDEGDHAQQVALLIESPGGALAQDELSRMFMAFHYTAEARKFGSLGLGLSVADAIVKLFRGRVDVQRMPSGGAIFRITLPLADSPAALPR